MKTTPVDFGRDGANPGAPESPLYLDELVELFDYCRPPHAEETTNFIWCHAGISRRVVVENLPHWID
ncbi:MAG: hypothetical protein KIS67_03770, partial [Verrucomicrobiae bacterium]|nr:hypothetical protein [Verrucomicrobiae bacterium]